MLLQPWVDTLEHVSDIALASVNGVYTYLRQTANAVVRAFRFNLLLVCSGVGNHVALSVADDPSIGVGLKEITLFLEHHVLRLGKAGGEQSPDLLIQRIIHAAIREVFDHGAPLAR